MTRPPAYQPKLKELTPRLERLFKERGWLDRRTVQRIERPDPAHVDLMNRIVGVGVVTAQTFGPQASRPRLAEV